MVDAVLAVDTQLRRSTLFAIGAEEYREDRVNAFEHEVTERFAAHAYHLDRADLPHCDGFSTPETPRIDADVPVEIKACRPWVANGDDYGTLGRWHVNRSTHADLLDEDGWYCAIVYELRQRKTVLIRSVALIEAAEIDALLPASGSSEAKLPWTAVFPSLRAESSEGMPA